MTNDTHFFSAKLAAEVGIAGATILNNIARMQVQHEYAGHSPFEYEGRWYVRHSYESLQQWHSYLSIQQIRRIMRQLEDDGYIIKSHLGKPFDRTLYWSVGRAVIDVSESTDALGEIDTSDVSESTHVQQTNNSKQKNRKTSIPDDFGISDGVRLWAEKNGHRRLNAHLDNFVDAAKSKDYRYVDWDSAFKTAIRKNWADIK